jgi:hypothetical protein
MTSRIIALSLVLLGSIQTGLAQAAATSSNGPTLMLTSTPEPHLFRVELHNSGTQDLVLDLGMALANGAKQYPNAIEFALTTSDGRILHLVPVNDLGMIGGRVDPLIVPLPSGATFSFLINLEKYLSPQEKDWKLHLSRGRYTLQAEYTGRAVPMTEANLDVKGIALMPYWVGRVASTPVVFTLTSEFGSPPDH